jgi:malonyl-CoA/methylmalonyl-CoA synthetase
VLIDSSGARVSAAMLDGWSAGVARRLGALGVGPQDRVLLSAEPSIDLVVAYVALLRLGAVVVPASTGYTGPELAHLIEDARPVLAVADRAERFATHCLPVVGPGVPGADHGPVPLDGSGPDELAWLCYTSGTTWRPKGAMLTHANLLAGADAVVAAWGWAPEDVLVLALPLFHMHGLGVGINGTLTAGAAAVVLPRFDVAAVLDARAAYDGTLFFGVPTMYARLVDSPRVAELDGFRLAVSGSAPLAPDLWQRVRDRSGVEVLERYGMTETVMLCTNTLAGPRIPGSVGAPLPGVDVRLADDGGVEVRGPAVFAGYWERPDATAAAFTADGWFRTGDIGEWAESGDLRLVGRSSELVITGGYNVYPREVEEVLREHPAVVDVAVVGVPDPVWGEVVVAFVVVATGSAPVPEELDAHVRERLAPHKRPRRWGFVDSLPRNAMGKLQRDRLLERHGAVVGG